MQNTLPRDSTVNFSLASILESSQDAIITRDISGSIVHWNPAAEKLFGYTQAEIAGKNIDIIIPDRLKSEDDHVFDRVKNNHKIAHFKTVRLSKDKKEIPVSLTVSAIKDLDGRVIGVVKIYRDLSMQQYAEEKQAMLAAIIESSGDAIISKSLDGYVTSWNAGAQQIFGYTESEVIGRPISFLIPPSHIFEEDIIITNIRKGIKVEHLETIRIAKDGREIPVSITVSPIKNKEGVIIGASKIARDISKSKRAEEDNAKLYAEIRDLNTKKDEFIGLASHELKTPLTSMKGFLQILERSQTIEANKVFIYKALRQLNKISGLVTDLLDVSKIQAGKLHLNYETLDFMSLLHDCIELVQFANDSHRIDVKSNFLILPIQADEQRIEQVIVNLLSNAIKYSPTADLVEINVRKNDTELIVGIKDFGFGISKDIYEHVFSRFYRAENVASHISGLGIGLFLSKEIIERHQGKMWIDSELGQGSEFFFSLPLFLR